VSEGASPQPTTNNAIARAAILDTKDFITDSSLLNLLSEIDNWVSHLETPSQTLIHRMRQLCGIFPIDEEFRNFGEGNKSALPLDSVNVGRIRLNQSSFCSSKSSPVFVIRTKLNVPEAIATRMPLPVVISA
jgi:hypothetical protein